MKQIIKFFRDQKLRNKLIAIYFCVGLLPLVIIGVFNFTQLSDNIYNIFIIKYSAITSSIYPKKEGNNLEKRSAIINVVKSNVSFIDCILIFIVNNP